MLFPVGTSVLVRYGLQRCVGELVYSSEQTVTLKRVISLHPSVGKDVVKFPGVWADDGGYTEAVPARDQDQLFVVRYDMITPYKLENQ